MRVTLYEMEANDEGSSRPVRSIEVETDADTSVAGLLEQGGFVEHEFFSLATETVTSRPTAFGDRCALIVLFGLDDAHRIQCHQYDQPLPWDYFVRAVKRGFSSGDPT